MKRFFTLLFTVLLLTAALCVNASASSFDDAAKDLAAIGMLQGDGSGFALDRAPTRSEAAIMLVRLFGAEDEAKAAYASGELSHSFTDVSDTASPYVAWLTVRGIANGTSATTFGASRPCTSQMYAAFLLRALGYQDKVDFEYADAQAFAMTRGILDLSVLTGNFLRDNLVSMTYQALGADLKDGSTYLLDSLIQSGAVDADAAKPINNKINALRALQKGSEAAIGKALDTDVNLKADFSYGFSGLGSEAADASTSISGKGNVKVIQNEEDIQMAMNLQMEMEDETMSAEYWLKDGVMYVRADGEAYKMTIPGFAELYQAASVSGNTTCALLPFLEEIEVKANGGNIVYNLSLNEALTDFVKGLVPVIFNSNDIDFDASMKGSALQYTFDTEGKLKSVDADMKLSLAFSLGETDAGPMSMQASVSMELDMAVNAAGDDVKITFPDFSGFQSIDGELPASVGVIGGADGPTSIFLTKTA